MKYSYITLTILFRRLYQYAHSDFRRKNNLVEAGGKFSLQASLISNCYDTSGSACQLVRQGSLNNSASVRLSNKSMSKLSSNSKLG